MHLPKPVKQIIVETSAINFAIFSFKMSGTLPVSFIFESVFIQLHITIIVFRFSIHVIEFTSDYLVILEIAFNNYLIAIGTILTLSIIQASNNFPLVEVFAWIDYFS